MTDSDLEFARQRMLRRQLERRGIDNPRVLAAMGRVPRERFVAESARGSAYADQALGIACGQTISQPYMVGLMTQVLRLTGTEKVLEIGTGSGYQTAVLAELAAVVFSIERFAELSLQAGRRLAELGYGNINLSVGDGSRGLPEHAPFDRVLVTAAAREVPAPLLDQLADGGLLVIPVGDRDCQDLEVVHKVQGQTGSTLIAACRFVPLIGQYGWPGEEEGIADRG